jgi:hypothetical protein
MGSKRPFSVEDAHGTATGCCGTLKNDNTAVIGVQTPHSRRRQPRTERTETEAVVAQSDVEGRDHQQRQQGRQRKADHQRDGETLKDRAAEAAWPSTCEYRYAKMPHLSAESVAR